MDTAPDVESDSDLCVVTCDASFKKGSAGLGVTVTWRGKTYTSKRVPRRAKGPVEAELFAIQRGLREARKLGASRVLVRSDSRWAVDFSNTDKFPERPHIRKAVDGVWRSMYDEFEDLRIEWIPREENWASDKASKLARKEAERKESARLERKAQGIKTAMERAQTVEVRQTSNGRWEAREKSGGPWFEVDLDNISCGCFHFTKHWAGAPLGARKKNMIPCKHMAAVGIATGFKFQ